MTLFVFVFPKLKKFIPVLPKPPVLAGDAEPAKDQPSACIVVLIVAIVPGLKLSKY